MSLPGGFSWGFSLQHAISTQWCCSPFRDKVARNIGDLMWATRSGLSKRALPHEVYVCTAPSEGFFRCDMYWLGLPTTHPICARLNYLGTCERA